MSKVFLNNLDWRLKRSVSFCVGKRGKINEKLNSDTAEYISKTTSEERKNC